MKYILFLSITIGLMNCKTSSKIAESRPRISANIYTTQKLNIIQSNKYPQKYGTHFYDLIIMALDLKADSTYNISYCQRKIAESGKWYVKKDSIYLYETKSFTLDKKLPNATYFINSRGYIFYNNGSSTGEHERYYTVLKIKGNLFDGQYDTTKMEPNKKVIDMLKCKGKY